MDFNDLQDIPILSDVIPQELLDAFGEENVNFGPKPPNLSDLSFMVNGLDYVYCKRYIFGPNGTYMLSPTDPPTHEGTLYYHHFSNHWEHLSHHKLKTIDPSGNIFIRSNDSTFIIGHDSLFTAYFQETIEEPHSGNPTNFILISGTLVIDTTAHDSIIGIRNYRIGKLIKDYERQPEIPSYAPGTIEVKIHEGISLPCVWDTIRQTLQ